MNVANGDGRANAQARAQMRFDRRHVCERRASAGLALVCNVQPAALLHRVADQFLELRIGRVAHDDVERAAERRLGG